MAQKFVVLQIGDMARLLHATRFSLDRLIRRTKFRAAIVRRRKWSRVIFTTEDVATLALAYWLFRSGLRVRAIQDVLASPVVRSFLSRVIDPESIEAEGKRDRLLVTWRVPESVVSGTTRRKVFGQKVAFVATLEEMRATLEAPHQFGFLLIPIGRLLRELAGRLRGVIQAINGGNDVAL